MTRQVKNKNSSKVEFFYQLRKFDDSSENLIGMSFHQVRFLAAKLRFCASCPFRQLSQVTQRKSFPVLQAPLSVGNPDDARYKMSPVVLLWWTTTIALLLEFEPIVYFGLILVCNIVGAHVIHCMNSILFFYL